MNRIKEIERINERELQLNCSERASWHFDYRDSAWIYVGGLNFGLTEGDLLAVFSQYGEIEDIDLVRDRDSGKSRGFAFLKYEDARSTVLAVDNFNGISLAGRLILVDHCREHREPRGKKDISGKFKEEEVIRKRRALEEPASYLQESKGEADMPVAEAIDPFLANKLAKEQEQSKLEQIKNEIAQELGIDKDDPMRDYFIDSELKRRHKHK